MAIETEFAEWLELREFDWLARMMMALSARCSDAWGGVDLPPWS
jgi:hypothetical protein